MRFGCRSRYISRYVNLKLGFLPFVVASIVAMVFLRRICSSRPGDGEQRGQSPAALTARGRGLDCFQPQPRQPVLRRNKLRIFRFRASAKAQSLRLFLLSPRSRLLRGDPIYSPTLCVQTNWAAWCSLPRLPTARFSLAGSSLPPGLRVRRARFPTYGGIRVAGYSVVWDLSFSPPLFPLKSTKRSAAAIPGRSAPSFLFMVRFGLFCCRQDYLPQFI